MRENPRLGFLPTPPTRKQASADQTKNKGEKQASKPPLAITGMEQTYIMIKPDGVQRGLVSIATYSFFTSMDSLRFGVVRLVLRFGTS